MADNVDKALEAIEVARTSGKIRKGANEVTKAIERGNAKLVAVAQDVTPKEIIMHIPLLAKDKGVPCVEIPQKDNLGASAGLQVGTAAVAIVQEGDAKKLIEDIAKTSAPKEEKKDKPKEEAEEKKDEKRVTEKTPAEKPKETE
jgi:large subunit ribosomal protein L7Ae